MISSINQAYTGIAAVNFWLKNRGGDPFTLADVPEIIPLRWTYFKLNWEFIKPTVVAKISTYSNPDFLQQQINDFSTFISTQRLLPDTTNPFLDSLIANKFYAVFDNILVESTDLSNDEQTIISTKQTQSDNMSRQDFQVIKDNITAYRDQYAAQIGLSDTTYNSIYSLSFSPALSQATTTNLNYLLTLQNSLKTINFILANLFAVDAAIDEFALARNNANNPNIDIGQYRSGRLVKLNYREDLQSLAYRYFGDANKWLDIAIANGLKPPYIDEVGERISIVANGQNSFVNLPQNGLDGNPVRDKIYINQIVILQSLTSPFPDQRTVIGIKEVPITGELVIELDGSSNLSKYTTADQAYVRVFKPDTTNSNFFILIPSQEPLQDTREDTIPWFMAKSTQDEKQTKIDLAVDQNGEINFTSNGDLMLSYGLSNAIQAIKFKLQTELGSLRYHPTYGMVNVIGSKNNNITQIKALITNSLNEQINSDSRFDRIETLTVDYLVNTASAQSVAAFRITMSVKLAGSSTVVPITFSLKV